MIKPSIQLFRLSLTLISIGASFWDPTFFQTFMAGPLIVGCVALMVIPHGALDHIVFYQLYLHRTDLSRLQKASPILAFLTPRLIFYIHYLAIMVLWGLAWKYQITLAFLVFLGLSAYHFGEGDLDYLQLNQMQATPLMFSRGLYVLSLIIFTQPLVTMNIIQKFIHAPWIVSEAPHLFKLLVTQHFVLLGSYALFYNCKNVFARKPSSLFPSVKQSPSDPDVWVYEIIKSVLLWILFESMNPLVAFTIYLGAWHSMGHMLSEITFLKTHSNAAFAPGTLVGWKDVARFLYKTAPFTMISLISMTSAFWFTCGLSSSLAYDDINAWTLFIISISILTGPHLWIVAAMHWLEIDLDPMQIKERVVSFLDRQEMIQGNV